MLYKLEEQIHTKVVLLWPVRTELLQFVIDFLGNIMNIYLYIYLKEIKENKTSVNSVLKFSSIPN